MANPPPSIPPHLQSPTILSLVVATAIVSGLAGYFLGQASSLGIFGSSSSSSRSSRRSSKRKRKTERKRDKEGEGAGSDVKAEEMSRDIKPALATTAEAAAAAAGGAGGAGGSGDDAIDGESESEASSIGSSEEDNDESDSTSQPAATTTTLSSFAASNEDFKMTLLLRTDLGMTKGKMAAQAAHAALLNYTLLQQSSNVLSPSLSPPSSPQTRTTHPALLKWQRSGQAKIALQVGSLEELEDVRRKAAEVGLCAGVVRDAGRTQVPGGSVTACAVGPGPRGVVDGVSGGLRLL